MVRLLGGAAEAPRRLLGVPLVPVLLIPAVNGTEYAYAADGSCVVGLQYPASILRGRRDRATGTKSLRFQRGVQGGVLEEENSIGLGTRRGLHARRPPCDFAAQGTIQASGAQLFFAAVIMSIVLYIVGGVAACAYHKQALVVFAGGIVFVEILFGVSLIILTMAPMEVFKASRLVGHRVMVFDPNGQAYCTRDWLTAVDGILGFGTIRLYAAPQPATFAAPRGPATRRA